MSRVFFGYFLIIGIKKIELTIKSYLRFYGTIQFLTINAPTVLLPVHKYRTGTIKNFEKVFLFFCIVPVTVLVQCKKQEKVSQYQYRKFAWYRIHTNRTYGTGIMRSSTTGILKVEFFLDMVLCA